MKRKAFALILMFALVGPVLGQAYTYSIANDMPGGVVNPSNLKREIDASSITTALLRIDTDDDALKLTFAEALSSGDKTTLDGDTTGPAGGLLADHSTAEKDWKWSKSRQASEISTTSASWADVMQAGIRTDACWYKVTVSYLGAADSTAQLITMRVSREGESAFSFQDACSGGIDSFAPRTFKFLYEEPNEGWRVWDLDWRRSGDTGTIKVKNVLMLIERME